MLDFVLDRLRGKAKTVSVPPPPIPDSLDLDVSNEAREEELEVLEGETLADFVGVTFAILYSDAKNNQTRRRVTVREIILSANEEILIRAYCHERRAGRTFRADRIQEVVDLETGEVIDEPLAFFSAIAIPGFAPSNDETTLALSRCRPGIQILVFLARCDGNYHPAEHAAIHAFVRDYCSDLSPDLEKLDRHFSTLHPDKENFFRALDAFVADAKDSDVDRLLSYVVGVTEADGIIHDEEFQFLVEIKTAFADAGRPIG